MKFINIFEKKTNYIYLLRLREFIKTNEPIYKIGRTTQSGLNRFNQYPKGSEIIIFRKCIDCYTMENALIKLFKSKYKYRKEYGNEYFEGIEEEMLRDINNILNDE